MKNKIPRALHVWMTSLVFTFIVAAGTLVADAQCPTYDSVAINKVWIDSSGATLAVPPTLSNTVMISATAAKAWLKSIYPAGDTAHPILTSALLRPDGAGSSWPDEISATFNSAYSVTANSTKDLSNVVLLFSDCTRQKFDSLSGYSRTFAGTGANAGKTVIAIWLHSGNNASGDGPGYGSYIGRALMIAGGVTYTVTETGLPTGWISTGLGTFTSNGGNDSHTVQNRMPQVPSGLGDRVWLDANANGIQDAGETGISNVTVRLLDGSGNALGATATTDANGKYLFTNLVAGAYAVQFVTPSGYVFSQADQGGDDTKDSDANATTGKTPPVTLAVGVTNLTFDAGMWQPLPTVRLVKTAGTAPDGDTYTINGAGSVTYTFLIQNTGNTWMKNLVVTDNKLGTVGTVTGPLAPSASTSLTATVSLSAGVTNVATVTGTPSFQSGDAVPGQAQVTASDQAVVRVLPLSKLGDFVWFDTNVNGIQDAGETGIVNITVRLLDGTGNALGPTTTTDANGKYMFTNLTAGTYSVQVVTPTGYVLTPADQGADDAKDSDANTTTGKTAPVTMAAGETNLTLDAGMWQPQPALRLVKTAGPAADGATYSINGTGSVTYTYVIQNTGNTWLNNLAVTDDKLGAIGSVAGTLAPGASATLTTMASVSANVTNTGTATGVPVTPAGYSIPNQSSVTATDLAIVRVLPLCSLGDFIWLDANANGIQNAGETGIAGITVRLLDGAGTALGPVTTTDANGKYLFSNLAAGAYALQFVAPSGFVISPADQGGDDAKDSDANPTTGKTAPVTLSPGETNLTLDAGGMWQAQPGVHLAKTAGTAADGEVYTLNGAGSVTYTFMVQNIGNTWLTNLVVTDDKIGTIGTVSGVLAPGQAAAMTATTSLVASVTNVGTVIGTPSTSSGEPIQGQANVTATDSAVVQVLPLSVLGDFVWLDTNANGIQDAGETGIANVTVRLLDENGNVLGPTKTTDVNGRYLFTNLVAGAYAVQVVPPADYILSAADQGADDAKDSDANATTGKTAPVTLAAGATNLTLDAGMWQPQSSVHLVKTAGTAADGAVYTINGAGSVTYTYVMQNTGNTWLKNLAVTDDKLGAIGTWTGLLAPGESATLTATATVAGNVTNLGAVTGTPATPAGDAIPGKADVSASDPAVAHVLPLSVLGDRVWLDTNANGIQDAGETGIVSVTVRLLDGSGNALGPTAATDWKGNYSFAGLTAGTYAVQFDLPNTHVFSAVNQGTDNAKDSDANVTTGKTAPVTLTPGETNLTLDAGMWQPQPAVHLVKTAGTAPDGQPFAINGSGSVLYTYAVQNTGNTWLTNVVVTDDKLGTIGSVPGLLAPGASATLTTNATVAGVVTNVGTVTATPATPAGGIIPGLAPVTATDNAVVRLMQLSQLGDFVWNDVNANGLQDAGETGIAGVIVQLCDSNGTALGVTTITDANGGYSFTNLPPGTYEIQFGVPNGYVFSSSIEGANNLIDSDADPSTGRTRDVALGEGMTNLTLDAGMWQPQPAVGLVKTVGTAPDGQTYTLSAAGSVTYTYVVTNSGNTWLKNLTVTDDKLGLIGTVANLLGPGETATLTKTVTVSDSVTNVGTVSGTPVSPHGDLIPGQGDVSHSDPAVVVVQHTALASLGDRVWVDANTNGIQDAGEPGLIGVTVTLLDTTNATLASTVTAQDGSYLFTDLAPGNYRVRFTLPTAAWHFVHANQGSDIALDSNANPADGLTPVITLASGQHDLTWDAGVYGGLPPGFCDKLTVGQNFNALIFGNFTALGEVGEGADTEGRLAVGGTASLPPNYSVGLSTMGIIIPPIDGAADMLIVGGDLYEPNNYADVNGNVVYGGTRTGPARYTGSNTIEHVVPVTLDDNGNVPRDGSGVTFEQIHQQLCLASAMIASMADRGVVTIDLDKTDHIITFIGNDAVLNVFNVNATDWSGFQMDIVINTPADSTVVFNIHGTSVGLSNGAIRLTGITHDRILFNYADATNIITSGFTHEGAVLAPYAGGSFSGGAFEGFGFFGGSVVTKNGFEFHHFPFRGNICTAADANPAIKLVVTVGDARDGDILTVLGGTDVMVTYLVKNTGDTWLDHVQVTDDLLGPIGSLANALSPGESATLTAILPNVTAGAVLHGTATGRPVRNDGTLWNGYANASGADGATISVGSPSGGGYDPSAAWQRADFAVTEIKFINEPTLTGEVFSVQVTVDNHGELAADAGRLTLYLSKPTAASVGEPGDASQSIGVLRQGESKTLTFQNLKADAVSGTHHLRAYVDSTDGVREWSEGDNQLTAVYNLNPIHLNITTVTTDVVELSWNSFWGQKYSLYHCTDLSKGFLLFKSHMEATPPLNTCIDVETTGARFYRLVAE